ncbi:MAG: hypothetical protein HY074_13305 [Deltaproteobacteria bacterium]|nr:hypothetical protein [Deltaproteobacteria bacterium]
MKSALLFPLLLLPAVFFSACNTVDRYTQVAAPDGAKDKVTEAFQAILAYNLSIPPQHTIPNVAPWSIPDWHVAGRRLHWIICSSCHHHP